VRQCVRQWPDSVPELEQRGRHDHAVNEWTAAAVAKQSRRGWRLDCADRRIDACVALAMAVDRCEQPAAEPVRLLGWL